MKKIVALMLGVSLIFGLSACGNNTSRTEGQSSSAVVSEESEANESETAPVEETSELETAPAEETSEPEVENQNNASIENESVEPGDDVEEQAESSEAENTEGKTLIAYFSHTGNTEEIAVEINTLIGGDLVEIVEADPYPSSYQECVDRAEQEKDNGSRPETTTVVENMDEYDTIYIGYPIWWHDAPMIIYTFLESYDLAGKTVIPFCTSGGSEIEESMPAINSLCAEATVLEGLTADGPEDVEGWLSRIGMMD